MWNDILVFLGLRLAPRAKTIEEHLAPLGKIVDGLRDHAETMNDEASSHYDEAHRLRSMAAAKSESAVKARVVAGNISRLMLVPSVSAGG